MKEGNIGQCIGAVIDVEFPRDKLPKIYDALTLEGSELTLEVQQKLGDGVVRTICLGSSDGRSRSLQISNTGGTIREPVGPTTLGRNKYGLGKPINEAEPCEAIKTS